MNALMPPGMMPPGMIPPGVMPSGSMFGELSNFSILRFAMSNPYLAVIAIVIIILAYLFMISPYRVRTPSYFAYITNIDEQVEEWITNISNDLTNVYFLKNEEAHVIDAIFSPGSSSKIKQLCEKMDFFIHTPGSNITDDYNDDNKTKILEKLNTIKNIFRNIDNGEDLDSFMKYKIFDFLIFVHNNFCNTDEIGAYFFYSNNYFHNMTYFVNRNFETMDSNRKGSVGHPPSIKKSSNNDVSYRESIIPFVYESYLKNVLDTLKKNNDDTQTNSNIMKDGISVSSFNSKNKTLWQLILFKVKEISLANKSLIIVNTQIIHKFFLNIKTIINVDEIKKYFEKEDDDYEDEEDERMNHFDNVQILESLNNELQSACSFNGEPTSDFFYEFENMLYAIENSYGKGALMKEHSLISNVMNSLHEIVLLHHFNKNRFLVRKAESLKERITTNHFNAFYSLQNLQISVGKQFPTLINNDSNQSTNMNRDKYMINLVIQKIIISIVNTWKHFGLGFLNIFSRSVPFSFHLKEKNDTLNMFMQYPSNFRMYLQNIQNNPGDFLTNALK